jgi:hypothetical protein
MSSDLLCTWFDLPLGVWPPDHYRLLGLPPGEQNVKLIEQRVEARMEAVRGYQILHPEQATEALNQLAQALVCLTDPLRKREYDRGLLGPSRDTVLNLSALNDTSVKTAPAPPVPATPPPLPPDGVVPTPPNLELAIELEPGPAQAAAEVGEEPPPPSEGQVGRPKAEPAPPSERVDPILEAAWVPAAWRGVETCRSLLARIAHTEKLLAIWKALEPYCISKRSLDDRAEARKLVKALGALMESMKEYPSVMGKPDQPGYWLIALAQSDVVPSYKELDDGQRRSLKRSWGRGNRLLTTLCQLYRDELRARESKPLIWRLRRALSLAALAQPRWVVLLSLLLIINLLVWVGYFSDWTFFLR